MIKLKNLLSEARLTSISKINNEILDRIVVAAQKEYDDWIQDENGMNDELGSGGICHLIADKILDVLHSFQIYDCQTVCSNYEQHVYIIGKFKEGVYTIDIPYHVYETGGGFTWKKIPNVKFDKDHIHIYRIDVNHRNFNQYTDYD